MGRVGWWLSVAALMSGCFVDLGSGSASGTTTASTSDATATPSDPSTSTGPGPTTSTTAETTPLESTGEPATTGPTCQPAGAPCSSNDASCCGCLVCGIDNTCTQGPCAACHHCTDDGSCAPDEPGTACTGPEDLCPTLAFGFVDDTCHAYAPASPVCDETATCVAGPCTAKGAAHITCPECRLPAPNCFANTPLIDISVADVCHTNGTTDLCTPSCTNASQLTPRSCNEDGACVAGNPTSCIPYSCNPQIPACKTSCQTDADCNIQFSCNGFNECG